MKDVLKRKKNKIKFLNWRLLQLKHVKTKNMKIYETQQWILYQLTTKYLLFERAAYIVKKKMNKLIEFFPRVNMKYFN